MIEPSENFGRIVLSEFHRSRIKNKVLDCPFREIAGFIVGSVEKDRVLAERVIFGESSGWGMRHFKLDGNFYGKVSASIRSDQILCLFHTHPGGKLYPTLWDIGGMMVTEIPWIILRLRDDKIRFRAYIYEKGVIRKIGVQVSARK